MGAFLNISHLKLLLFMVIYMAEQEKSFVDKLKEDRGAALMALVALLLIIFGVFAVLGGPAMVTLNPPTNLQGTVIGNDIKLTWDHSVDYPDPCIGYNAYLSTTAGQLGVLQNAELITDNKYTIRDVKPGTYYATVRCSDINGNEDGNLNQVEIKVEIQPPSGLSVIINDGAEYTNKRDVTLALSATNAEECAYANEDMAWSAWGPYTVEKAWTLTSNAGEICEEKKVYYRCRNSGVESSAVSDTIILDTLPPSVSFNVLSTQDNLVALQIFAQDDCVRDVDCYVFAGDQQVAVIQNMAREVERTVEVPYGKFYLTVSCIDDAGNAGSAALEMNVEQKAPKNETNVTKISIKINNDAPTTTSLNVILNLYARINGEIPDKCYYRSTEMGEVGPESYTTSRTWTLDKTEPENNTTYTVCYRCEKDKKEAEACDSIRYVVEGAGDGGGGGGGGDGGGGGGDGGNQPPKDLRAEIIGKRLSCIGYGPCVWTLVFDTEVTRWNDVYINLSSSGATACKVWNEPMPNVNTTDDEEGDVKWDANLRNGIVDWKLIPKIVLQLEQPGDPNNPFSPRKEQDPLIVVPDGNRTINYKCNNSAGTTGPVKDSIWYDATPPGKVADLSGEYRTQLGEGDVGLPMINIKLTWTPAVDNSFNWEGYTHKGIQLYSICRSYTLAGPRQQPVDLGCEDYTPGSLGCAEGGDYMALKCAFIDMSLPHDLTTQGGQMCYDVSAWDYVGWESEKTKVCVDVPAQGPIDEVPTIEWVAIYESKLAIGEEREEIKTVEKTTGGISTQNSVAPLVLLAQPDYEPAPPIRPAGDAYTRTANVIVRVMAENASKCMLGNDGGAPRSIQWSGSWEDYTTDPTPYDWTILDQEGTRYVYVKCRNQYGESDVSSDSIVYDHTPPEVVGTGWKADYVETCEKNYIYVRWPRAFDDKISGVKDYTVREYTRSALGGGGGKGEPAPAYNWTETGNWTTSDTYLYDYVFVKDKTYKYTITACDNAGNCNGEGVTTAQVTPPKNPYNVPCE